MLCNYIPLAVPKQQKQPSEREAKCCGKNIQQSTQHHYEDQCPHAPELQGWGEQKSPQAPDVAGGEGGAHLWLNRILELLSLHADLGDWYQHASRKNLASRVLYKDSEVKDTFSSVIFIFASRQECSELQNSYHLLQGTLVKACALGTTC